jgi:hypothetical protein
VARGEACERRLRSKDVKAKGTELAVMIAMAVAAIPVLLALWLGPVAYGVALALRGDTVVGGLVTAAGAVWLVLHLRDKTLPALLVGTIQSLLIQAGLMKDPWDDPGLAALDREIADGDADRPT